MKLSHRLRMFVSTLAAIALTACQPADRQEAPERETAAPADMAADGVVEVVARDFAFDAPTEIPSGWTTFRLRNEGAQEHFMYLWRLPEGATADDYATQVVPAFDSAQSRYSAGELDRGQAMEMLGGLLPEWFASVTGAGGAGFLSPGAEGQTTVRLDPGTYVMECYVKTPDGRFHGSLGMLHPLTVTTDASGVTPPEFDVDMTLSNYAIATEGDLTAGRHTIRVRYEDDPEGLLPHDVHLVRLSQDVGVDDVIPWLDWMDALTAPAPARFLGGAENMSAGNTAYLTVELEPGDYAWISEMYASRGMVSEFTVE